jgi:hypothetical protein
MAIFGITEVPTGGVEFDTADFVADGSAESDGPTSSMVTDYAPPPEATQQTKIDPELGTNNNVVSTQTEPSIVDPTTTTITTTLDPIQTPASKELLSQTNQRKDEEIGEID